MPFQRPTLEQLRQRSVAQLQARLGTGPLLERSILRALGDVVAGHSHGLHGHLAWAARQATPVTGDAETVDTWASLFGITRKPATLSVGAATLSGVNGTVLPSGKRMRRADGAEYATTSEGTIAGGSATVEITALLAGDLGNAQAGAQLTLTAPVVGIASSAVVAPGGATGGADAEDTEALRARVLQRTRRIPAAGSVSDIEGWALEVAGVTRAWCFPRFPAVGSSGLTFATDDDPAGPIPTAAKVAEVTAHLDTLKPVGGQLIVFAPAPLQVNVNVVLTPNTDTVRAEVELALRDLFRRQAEPGRVLYVSHMREAVSGATGEIDSVIVSPIGDVFPERGQLPVLGSLSFQ